MNIYEKYTHELTEFIKKNVAYTLKQPNGYLKEPFVDPGSIYDGNLWDWDSFWSVYALFGMIQDTSHEPDSEQIAKKELYLQHAKGNIANFFANQLEDGYIPMMIEKTDLPEPYLNLKHKEGIIMNMMKPFLCLQISLISGFCGDYQWVIPYMEKIERYFQCYDKFYYNSCCGLYVWADDIMIGMDNDPATFGRPKFSTANMFLNSFMVRELQSMSLIAEKLGKSNIAAFHKEKAVRLIESIQRECWDPRDQFFYSADVDVKTRQFDWFHKGLGVFWNTLPIKIRAFTGFLPLWAGFASYEQAASIVKLHLMDEKTFNSPFGIRSLAKDEKMYDLSVTNNPSNWLGPIWVIVNYITFRGLLNYGYVKEAREICHKTLLLLGRDLEKTGVLHEYYNPETGEPIMNGGFMNWNMLILNMVNELAGIPAIDRYLGK